MSNNHSSTKDFLLGALVGSVVGAVTAILLTPKSGKAIREDIKEVSVKVNPQEIRKKGQYLLETAKEKSTQIGQAVSEQKNQLLSKWKEGKLEQQEEQAETEGSAIAEDSAYSEEKQYIPLQTYSEKDVQEKLEETKEAFDQAEKKLNQEQAESEDKTGNEAEHNA